MNNRPPISSTSNVISSYRKRRKRNTPNLIFILAILLVLGGLGVLIYWLFLSPNNPVSEMLATETPTPTLTPTVTATAIPTNTIAVTETPTETVTPTPTFASPFNYTVQEGDFLSTISEKFNLGIDGVQKIISLNPYGGVTDQGYPIGIDPTTLNIVPGQVITIPNPSYELPTAVPVCPSNLPKGTKIDYTVQAGDSMLAIEILCNSLKEEIMKENGITDPNQLYAGQILKIPVNLVTPEPTRPPTSTPITPGPGTLMPTATMTPIN